MKTLRQIVHIDEEKCDGCAKCVPSCAEGAIRIINGKAKLIADNLCDGLGACLGHCPKGAITVEEREADDYDELAVQAHLTRTPASTMTEYPHAGGCPGSALRTFSRAQQPSCPSMHSSGRSEHTSDQSSELNHWPVQLMLLPEQGAIWHDADLLLCADCVPFAMSDFHTRLLRGKTLAVACPKLDDAQHYIQKLARILANNPIRSITIARMQVPCCGGLEQIVQFALHQAGVEIPVQVVIVNTNKTLVRCTNT